MTANIFARALWSAFVLCCFGTSAGAQTYPDRPVRIIVPFPPGGGSDVAARALAQSLSDSLGKSFIVDNRPGAGGAIGTEVAARSPADGYTLLLADTSHIINMVVTRKPRYDAVKDFTPVAMVATTPLALMANPSFEPSLKQLLTMPREETEKVDMGISGVAGGPHMTYLLVRLQTGLTLNEVQYKGATPAMIDTVSGQIPLVFTSLAAGVPHLRSGKLKAIGVTSAARHPLTPDAPTFQESGLNGVVVLLWYGFLAPVGTPPDRVALLQRELMKALETPFVRERFDALALDVAPRDAEQFRGTLEADFKLWGDVATRSGLKVD